MESSSFNTVVDATILNPKSELQYRFRNFLTAGDLNSDGINDLAIDAVGITFGDYFLVGKVVALFGGSTFDTIEVASYLDPEPEFLARFGHFLALANFDGNGQDELIVGAPGLTAYSTNQNDFYGLRALSEDIEFSLSSNETSILSFSLFFYLISQVYIYYWISTFRIILIINGEFSYAGVRDILAGFIVTKNIIKWSIFC